jgi:hypothetical protein
MRQEYQSKQYLPEDMQDQQGLLLPVAVLLAIDNKW